MVNALWHIHFVIYRRHLLLLTLCHYIEHRVIFLYLPSVRICLFDIPSTTGQKDRDKMQKTHLSETVEELKRFNARRKLKGAVQAISGGVTSDPICGTETDSGNITHTQSHICLRTVAAHDAIVCTFHSLSQFVQQQNAKIHEKMDDIRLHTCTARR